MQAVVDYGSPEQQESDRGHVTTEAPGKDAGDLHDWEMLSRNPSPAPERYVRLALSSCHVACSPRLQQVGRDSLVIHAETVSITFDRTSFPAGLMMKGRTLMKLKTLNHKKALSLSLPRYLSRPFPALLQLMLVITAMVCTEHTRCKAW